MFVNKCEKGKQQQPVWLSQGHVAVTAGSNSTDFLAVLEHLPHMIPLANRETFSITVVGLSSHLLFRPVSPGFGRSISSLIRIAVLHQK